MVPIAWNQQDRVNVAISEQCSAGNLAAIVDRISLPND
jgi:hypothetical protein